MEMELVVMWNNDDYLMVSKMFSKSREQNSLIYWNGKNSLNLMGAFACIYYLDIYYFPVLSIPFELNNSTCYFHLQPW